MPRESPAHRLTNRPAAPVPREAPVFMWRPSRPIPEAIQGAPAFRKFIDERRPAAPELIELPGSVSVRRLGATGGRFTGTVHRNPGGGYKPNCLKMRWEHADGATTQYPTQKIQQDYREPSM